MRLEKQKESKEFTDRFGDTRIQSFMNYLFYNLHPGYAYHNVREQLIKRGMLKVDSKSPFGPSIYDKR